MKVEIDKDGVLTVEAETQLEAYALRKWSDENMNYTSDQVEIESGNFITSYGLNNG